MLQRLADKVQAERLSVPEASEALRRVLRNQHASRQQTLSAGRRTNVST